MSRIHIEAVLLDHEGGTKFYEVNTFWNPDKNSGVLVRRWGKVSVKLSGGEVKTESYSDVRKLHDSARTLLSSKKSRGYDVSRKASFGLHDAASSLSLVAASAAIVAHYGGNDYGVCDLLGVGFTPDVSGVNAEEIEPEVVPVKPKPVRGGEWGSW